MLHQLQNLHLLCALLMQLLGEPEELCDGERDVALETLVYVHGDLANALGGLLGDLTQRNNYFKFLSVLMKKTSLPPQCPFLRRASTR